MKIIITSILFITFTFTQPPRTSDSEHENARMMKKWKLIEYLDLNEEQSTLFFTMVNEFKKEHKEILQTNRSLRENMHNLVKNDRVEKNDIEKLVNEYFDNRSQIEELRRKHHLRVQEVLNSDQVLKYLLFDHKFKKRLKNKLLEDRDHRKP